MTFDIIAEMYIISGAGLRDAKKALERALVIQALTRTEGNCTKAAKILSLHRNQLASIMRTHEIDRKKYIPNMYSHEVIKTKISKRRLQQIKKTQAG